MLPLGDPNMSMNLIIVCQNWDHFSSVSGINAFCRELEKSPHTSAILGPESVPPVYNSYSKVCRKIKQRFSIPSVSPTPFRCMETLVSYAIYKQQQKKNRYLFLLSAETQIGVTLANASDEVLSRTIALFHQPPSWLKLYWRDLSLFSRLGHILVLSDEQRDYIRQYSSRPIQKIRHGIEHRFFVAQQKSTRPDYPVLLCVGQWLRDFSVLEASFRLIAKRYPTVRLNCVIPRDARSHHSLLSLARHEGVAFFSELPAHELRQLYSEADLLFLPLIDATANNAIVESLSCGLPVISTDVGGMRDYVPPDVGELLPPGDAGAHADAAIRWITDESRRQRGSKMARVFTEEHLCWRVITSDLLSKLNHYLA